MIKFPILNNLNVRIARKPLKEAFDKIKTNPIPPKLKAAIKALQNCRDREGNHAFFRWKLAAITKALGDKTIDLNKTIDGIAKKADTELNIADKLQPVSAKIIRKPLRAAFQMLKTPSPVPDKLKRLGIAIKGYNNKQRQAFDLWKLW